MAVDLTASETLGGAAIDDELLGGGVGQKGADMGLVSNQFYTPIISKSLNSGHKDIYIRHNGTSLISTLGVYISTFGAGTGFTYGGTDTPSADLATITGMGSSSGTSKNNDDGNSGGFWMEMDSQSTTTTQFDIGARPNEVKTFGKASEGVSLATYFLLHSKAMVYNDGGETPAAAPVTGQVGASGDTNLGDAAHLKFRYYVPTSYLEAKSLQWETVFSYSFTA